MNITWKDYIDSKRACVDRGEIMVYKDDVYKDDAGFIVEIQPKIFVNQRPIILKPFKTEAEAMIKAHMFVENHRHDLFPFRSFRTLQNDVVGYKVVIVYSSEHDCFARMIIKVTIPKGTIVHYPDLHCQYQFRAEFKYRAQDAIINHVENPFYHKVTIPKSTMEAGDILLSAHCCSKILKRMLNGFYGIDCSSERFPISPSNPISLSADAFIEQVRTLGGVYSAGMSIHIPDFSLADEECGEGFHYFLTYDEASRYSYRFIEMISSLNKHISKKEANNG